MSLDIPLSFCAPSRLVLHPFGCALTAPTRTNTTFADSSLRCNFVALSGLRGDLPPVRAHSLAAQPPDLHPLALIIRASWFTAHSPCLVVPRIRFLFIGTPFMLHAFFPHSVTLMPLRFTLLTVTSSQRDLHPQVCAHAGHTRCAPMLGAP